ncbi:hypothetical protein [Kordiimonas sp.]|uniref:hypothetical protein n=1 Tax=Kordiimonas sp. TaxID=1970157 RepID=UPI003A92A4C6
MKIRLEVLVSITAMVTAVAAVVVAILQTQVMHEEASMEREHQRLSVMPALLVYTGSHIGDDKGSFNVGLVNQGIGPAVIESFSAKVEGVESADWEELVAQGTGGQVQIAGDARNVDGVTLSDLTPGTVVPAGENVVPIKLDTTPENAAILRDFSDRLVVSVCYCSLYEECWNTSNQRARPTPVKMCPSRRGDAG